MAIILNINDLIRLAPPPVSPIDAGSVDRWVDIELSLKIQLPDDYKLFINVYGSGEFCDLISVLNPFENPPKYNLLNLLHPLLEPYIEGKSNPWLAARCPFPVFPESGGLLPCATDSSGGTFFWVTEGHPNTWPVVLYDWRGGYDSELHRMPLTDLLAKWLSCKFPNWFFGAGDLDLSNCGRVFVPSKIAK